MSVKVYTTPSCPYCGLVKRYLESRSVMFECIDVSKDTAAADEMVRKSGQRGVPVLDIDGKMIVGFEQTKIDDALSK